MMQPVVVASSKLRTWQGLKSLQLWFTLLLVLLSNYQKFPQKMRVGAVFSAALSLAVCGLALASESSEPCTRLVLLV